MVKFLQNADHKLPQRPFLKVILSILAKKAIFINKQLPPKSHFPLFSRLQSTFYQNRGGGPEKWVGNGNLQRLCCLKALDTPEAPPQGRKRQLQGDS